MIALSILSSLYYTYFSFDLHCFLSNVSLLGRVIVNIVIHVLQLQFMLIVVYTVHYVVCRS